jgi:glycosyltransferase involved in cell wall biosynthesis
MIKLCILYPGKTIGGVTVLYNNLKESLSRHPGFNVKFLNGKCWKKIDSIKQIMTADICVFSLWPSLLFFPIALLFGKKKVIFYHSETRVGIFDSLLHRIFTPLSEIILCDSKAVKSIVEQQFPKSSVFVISCFIKFDNKYDSETLGYNLDYPEFFYWGRLSEEKRIVEALKMVEDYSLQRDISCDFHLIGDGGYEYKKRLIRVIESFNKLNVILHGPVTHRKIPNIVNANGYMIINSDYEGLCMSALEALSLGIIVLSRPVGEIPSYIKPRHSGFLFNNQLELFSSLDIILSSKLLKKKIRLNGQRLTSKLAAFDVDFFNLMTYINDKS